jgi:Tol biopolymer transport system component
LATGQTDLLAAANDCFGASWAGDGSILFVPERNSPIMRIPRPGAEAQKVAIEDREDSQRNYASPSLLPDGRHILYTVSEAWEGGENSGVYAATIDGKEERRILPFLTNARFVAPGYLVYGRDGSLRAQRFDPERLALSGEPVTLLDGVQYLGSYQAHVFAISDNGLLAYVEGSGTLSRQFTWVDRKGALVGTIGSPGNFFSPRLSHDGRFVAYDLSDAATDNGDIWVFDLERGIPTRLTFDPRNESAPFWSPDDTRIAFFRNFPGGRDIFSIASDGRGNQETILSNGRDNMASDWSSDGASILVQSRARAGAIATDLEVVSVQKKTAAHWLDTPFTEKQARFSPDGKWIAYDSDESGRMEVYVRAFASPGGKWRVSSAGGSSAVWNRNGRELFYLTPSFELMSVAVASGATLQGGTPIQLFKVPGETLDLGTATQYDVSPDGQRFLMNLNVATQGQKLITLVSHWTELLGGASSERR